MILDAPDVRAGDEAQPAKNKSVVSEKVSCVFMDFSGVICFSLLSTELMRTHPFDCCVTDGSP